MPSKSISAFSAHPIPSIAVGELVGQLLEHDVYEPALLLVFAHSAHAGAFEDICHALRSLVRPKTFVAVITMGTITADGIHLDAPSIVALSIGSGDYAAKLRAFDDVTYETGENSPLLLLADGFHSPALAVEMPLANTVEGSMQQRPTVFGAYLHGAMPGRSRFCVDGEITHSGVIEVRCNPSFASITSQGMRAIGLPHTVTQCNGQTVSQLGALAPLEVLERLLQSATPEEKAAVIEALVVGVASSPHGETIDQSQFVMADIVSLQEQLTISTSVSVGDVMQFHIRDELSSHSDLVDQLSGVEAANASLIFDTPDRGLARFSDPNHDPLTIESYVDAPLAGCIASRIIRSNHYAVETLQSAVGVAFF